MTESDERLQRSETHFNYPFAKAGATSYKFIANILANGQLITVLTVAFPSSRYALEKFFDNILAPNGTGPPADDYQVGYCRTTFRCMRQLELL